MPFDLSSITGLILKSIPEAQVAAVVDSFVDAEVAKGGAELKVLVKALLDKVYGTSMVTAPLSTSGS